MFRCRHAATFLVGTFLVFPTLSSAQEIDLDLPSFDVSVSVDIPDAGAHVPEFTDFNVSDPGIASGISEALVELDIKPGSNPSILPDVEVDEEFVAFGNRYRYRLALANGIPTVSLVIEPLDPDTDDDAETANPLFLNPLFLNPDIFSGTDPGITLLELLSVVEEEFRSRLQQGRVLLDSDFGP